MKNVTILRGPSGCGKSSHIKGVLKNQSYSKIDASYKIVSADNFFMQDGEYKFDVTQLKQAHQSCRLSAFKSVYNNCPLVIIDNTNVTMFEMKAYKTIVLKALENGYDVQIKEPQTFWAFDVNELVKRNNHDVTIEIIERRLKKWVKNITVDDIIA